MCVAAHMTFVNFHNGENAIFVPKMATHIAFVNFLNDEKPSLFLRWPYFIVAEKSAKHSELSWNRLIIQIQPEMLCPDLSVSRTPCQTWLTAFLVCPVLDVVESRTWWWCYFQTSIQDINLTKSKFLFILNVFNIVFWKIWK